METAVQGLHRVHLHILIKISVFVDTFQNGYMYLQLLKITCVGFALQIHCMILYVNIVKVSMCEEYDY